MYKKKRVRNITITDTTGSIPVALWGEHSELSFQNTGEIILHNVEIGESNRGPQVESTPSFKVEVSTKYIHTFFKWCKHQKGDLVFIQETYWTSDIEVVINGANGKEKYFTLMEVITQKELQFC